MNAVTQKTIDDLKALKDHADAMIALLESGNTFVAGRQGLISELADNVSKLTPSDFNS